MGFNDHIEDDDGFKNFLQEIIDACCLDPKAVGITKQVIDKGEESLSDKQSYVFKKEVLDIFTVSECSFCGLDVPWDEMYGAATDDGMCSHCRYNLQKDD